MLNKPKIWLGAGAVAAAAGALTVGTPAFRASHWPAHLRAVSGEVGETAVRLGESRGSETTDPLTAGTAEESGEAGEHDTVRTISRVEDFAGGSFAVALADVLGGEGGKDGLGITPLTYGAGQWSFSVPALTGSQLNQAIAGNSLRSERHFALHFERDGHYRGWSLSWSKAPMSHCPSKSGPNHGVFDSECWIAGENMLTGAWTVKNGALCMTPAPRGVLEGNYCVRTALMLNSLVFFRPDGRMIGKGAELLPGYNAARERAP